MRGAGGALGRRGVGGARRCWGALRDAEGPCAGPQLAAGLARPVPWGAPGLAGAFDTPAPRAAAARESAAGGAVAGCPGGRDPAGSARALLPARRSNYPPRLFSVPKCLALCSPHLCSGQTTAVNLPVTRAWSLRAAAALRPFPEAVPRWWHSSPWAVGCEVAVSRGVRQQGGEFHPLGWV